MNNVKYHYESGAIHNDNHKEININTVSDIVAKEIVRNFLKDDIKDVEYEEFREDDSSLPTLCSLRKGVDNSETTGPLNNISDTIITQTFKNQSGFVKKILVEIIKDFYNSTAANLALIEITLYDHNLLHKRNHHKSFVNALVAWNLINVSDEKELNKIVRAVADKFKRMPEEGYKSWSNDFVNDKSFCENIGKKLGDTIKYNR